MGEAAEEHVVLLGDHGHGGVEGGFRHRGHFGPSDAHRPRRGCVDSGDQAPQRRFSGAGGPDDRDSLPAVDVQRHAVQHVLALAVGKMHVFDVQGGVNPAGGIRSRRLRPCGSAGDSGGA